MKWFDSWNWASKYQAQFWDKGFTLLESSKGRSLLCFSVSRSSIAQCYTMFINAGTEGLELSVTAGKYNVAIGIGVRV